MSCTESPSRGRGARIAPEFPCQARRSCSLSRGPEPTGRLIVAPCAAAAKTKLPRVNTRFSSMLIRRPGSEHNRARDCCPAAGTNQAFPSGSDEAGVRQHFGYDALSNKQRSDERRSTHGELGHITSVADIRAAGSAARPPGDQRARRRDPHGPGKVLSG